MSFTQQQLNEWQQNFPVVEKAMSLEPLFWQNPKLKKVEELPPLPVSKKDMEQAAQLWRRFAPFLAKAFPETRDGIIESPLREIPEMKKALNERSSATVRGDVYLKCDSELPIAGSVKARGGIFEVLQHAENLAMDAGLLAEKDSYEKFLGDEFIQFFHQYSIGVGSTGNLGLSIGIMGAKLGFQTSVYMSADAKPWKKDLLRQKGAIVHEFSGDFSEAITEGREQTRKNPKAYFVDDEKSKPLFLGYSVAAFHLKEQLALANVRVDREHPLFVYLPCGVGGAPGGITFGLKQVFGDAVHCFFVEPTHSPAVLIGLATGEKEKVCVQDFGIDNRTEGDGLAVGRPSSFASSISEHLVSGIYTIEDEELFKGLALLSDSEGVFIEPSAAAGLWGPTELVKTDYLQKHEIDESKAVHIVWVTGGALVPEHERVQFYGKGKKLL